MHYKRCLNLILIPTLQGNQMSIKESGDLKKFSYCMWYNSPPYLYCSLIIASTSELDFWLVLQREIKSVIII